MKKLEQEWDGYRAMVLSPDAPAEQVMGMRRTFYAGAFCYATAQLSIAALPDDKADVEYAALFEEVRLVMADEAQHAADEAKLDPNDKAALALAMAKLKGEDS